MYMSAFPKTTHRDWQRFGRTYVFDKSRIQDITVSRQILTFRAHELSDEVALLNVTKDNLPSFFGAWHVKVDSPDVMLQ